MSSLYKSIGEELELGSLISKEFIQSLWSGYGELVRLYFEKQSIIVKHIKLPEQQAHPRDWATKLSHKRKLHSYKVEVNWYENFSKTTDENCLTPKGLKTFKKDDEWLIVMEDLQNQDLAYVVSKANEEHIISVLSWLASFHAKYMGKRSDLLWEEGTYWHLKTRPDELEVLEKGELKDNAHLIDKVLKETKYQTFVHGDAKLANFCFNFDGTKCGAVDFQYVGHGCGMKDVAYFMSSCIYPHECESQEAWILDTYFLYLEKALKYYQLTIDGKEVEKQWRELFSIAWADFHRFIKGWSPTHIKINEYSEKLAKKALKKL